MIVPYELVEDDDLLVLAMNKFTVVPKDPKFFLYTHQSKMMLHRDVQDKYLWDIKELTVEVIKKYAEIKILESSILDVDDFLTYYLPIQIIDDPNLDI